MLAALVAALYLWWPRPSKLPTLHLVGLHENQHDSKAYPQAVIELRNDTTSVWSCTHQFGGSMLIAEAIPSGGTKKYWEVLGNTFTVSVEKEPCRLETWLQKLRLTPGYESHELTLYIPCDFAQTVPFEKSHSTRKDLSLQAQFPSAP
jgi:hypothetical protein